MIKLTFYLVIISSSSLIGFIYGDIYNNRARSLQDLEYCIRLLESEVLVGNTTLPNALDNVYRKGRGKVANIFKDIWEDLYLNEREDIYLSFLSLKGEYKKKYSLDEKDIETLLYLGKILGKTNSLDQGKNFKFIIKEIQNLYYEANLEKKVYEKLYRSLGVLLGIGIIIMIV